MSEALRVIWAVALNDLRTWLRSPWQTATSLAPPLGMAALLAVLTLAVGKQPVALVVEGKGPAAARMAQLFRAEREAYRIRTLDAAAASRALKDQSVVAIVRIPSEFDDRVLRGNATVQLDLNNIDLDFSDDIRRTVTRTVAEFDAPELGENDSANPAALAARPSAPLPQVSVTSASGSNDENGEPANPYLISVAEHDLRRTAVSLLRYQVTPILILVVIDVGLLGTALLAAREFELRTATLLLCSPARRLDLVVGKLLGGVLSTAAVLAPMIAVLVLTHQLAPPRSHWIPVLALLAAATVMAVGLGLFVGISLRQGRLIAMVCLNIATSLFFLGGGFTTIAFLPSWLQTISRLVPTSYAIAGLRQALFYPNLDGFGRDMCALVLSALLAAAAGTLALSREWKRA